MRVTLLGCQGSFAKGQWGGLALSPQPMCPGWGTALYHGHTVCTRALYLGRWAPMEFVGHLRFTCVSNPCSVITSVVSLHRVVDLEVTLQGPWAFSLHKCRHGAPNHSTPNFPLADYCLLEVLLAGKAVVLLSIREESYTLSAMIRAFCAARVPTLTPPG